MTAAHEHVFVEEQEPNGRLVLPPCLVCGLTAMDALGILKTNSEAPVYTFFHEDGPIRVSEDELVSTYMDAWEAKHRSRGVGS